MSGSPTANETSIGAALGGRYRLDAEIGHGGMSTVYKAFDTVLERPVAVKVMHRDVASDADQHERFRREARAVAQLSHPHIVTVIDFDDGQSAAGGGNGNSASGRAGGAGGGDGAGGPNGPGGPPYIVFEHVEGETLKSLIRRQGRLETTEALAYALEIARALATAHEHMIVHRDVKPQNVLIGNEGTAKITDFGIARSLTEQGLTMDGRVLGTTDYVSPEQALGQAVTVQSDIYSLGVVLYEMLLGEVPFRGETPVAVAMRHVREEVPDVQMRRPELSAATAAVVDRATAKDLSRRYPDMDSMIADLEEALAIEAARAGYAGGEATSVLRTLPAPARQRLPWRMRHPMRWLTSIALVGVAIAAVLIFVLGHTKRGTGVPPEVRASPGLVAVDLAQSAAHGYNPFGTEEEDPAQIGNVVDGDPGTSWSTQEYREDTLSPKPGTGFYVDAAPGVSARAVVVQTPTPGMEMAIYAAHEFNDNLSFGNPTTLAKRGWTPVAAPVPITSRTKIALATSGKVYRYYLFWITSLPAGRPSAEISEVTLLR
jgi:hypothetical protein